MKWHMEEGERQKEDMYLFKKKQKQKKNQPHNSVFNMELCEGIWRI